MVHIKFLAYYMLNQCSLVLGQCESDLKTALGQTGQRGHQEGGLAPRQSQRVHIPGCLGC